MIVRAFCFFAIETPIYFRLRPAPLESGDDFLLELTVAGRNAVVTHNVRHLAAARIAHPRSMADTGELAYIPVGLIHQSALQESIDKAKSVLGPEVWHLAYRVGEDNTGEPSIFFRITLQDFAMTESTISDFTGRVATALFEEIRPLENWGLRPYFNFRSVSEQQKRPDPDWV